MCDVMRELLYVWKHLDLLKATSRGGSWLVVVDASTVWKDL